MMGARRTIKVYSLLKPGFLASLITSVTKLELCIRSNLPLALNPSSGQPGCSLPQNRLIVLTIKASTLYSELLG
jgi:hypothetical protein